MLGRVFSFLNSALALILRGLIRGYQLSFSAIWGSQCRFYPTCSNYAMQAIYQHGPFKGVVLSIYRVARCGPCGGHGFDPVPKVWHEAFVKRHDAMHTDTDGACHCPHDHKTKPVCAKQVD